MNPLFIYDPLNGSAEFNWQIDSVRNVTKVSDPCLVFPKQPCYTVLFCHADVKAPSGAFGFTAFVEDCCLLPEYKNLFYLNNNSEIDDLPLSGPKTGCTPNFDGQVYNSIVNSIKIPQLTPDFFNSSPIFKDEDTIINICVADTLSYMVKATDPDGDSIAYHFSNPQNYLVKTIPVTSYAIVTKPPFSTLNYTGPIYSSGNPLGKEVSLNPVTGLVSGTITDTGTYLMTISALEYRKGKIIDSISKNFIVHVFDCSLLPKPIASLPALINNCKSLSIDFPNNSSPLYPSSSFNNSTFLWSFGDGDTSTAIYPNHIYADTGTYPVQLIIFPGLRCADTAFSKAIVYPSVSANFTFDDSCSDQKIHFLNTSSSTSGSINSAKWNFILGKNQDHSVSSYNATYSFTDYNKSFPVILTVGNDKGCVASDTQFVNIYKSPLPLAFHDTVISKGASLQLFADDGFSGFNASFLWTPSSGLSNPFIANPVVKSTKDQTYYVTIKNDFNCTLTDSVRITYYNGPDIYVPNAFTPNGDGLNDVFRPFQVGISKFYYFRVYNRWGQLVFETSQDNRGWDGKMKGNIDAPKGVYVWEVSGTDYLGHKITKRGTVILIR